METKDKKPFKETKVGKFLSEKAPQIFSAASNIPGPIGTVFGVVKNLVGKTEDLPQLDKDTILALIEIEEKEITADTESIKTSGANVLAEIQGESWLQRNWRPIFMLLLAFILANTYIFVPYFKAPNVPLDENIWRLITIGFTGYGAERGMRKLGVNLSELLKRKS